MRHAFGEIREQTRTVQMSLKLDALRTQQWKRESKCAGLQYTHPQGYRSIRLHCRTKGLPTNQVRWLTSRWVLITCTYVRVDRIQVGVLVHSEVQIRTSDRMSHCPGGRYMRKVLHHEVQPVTATNVFMANLAFNRSNNLRFDSLVFRPPPRGGITRQAKHKNHILTPTTSVLIVPLHY